MFPFVFMSIVRDVERVVRRGVHRGQIHEGTCPLDERGPGEVGEEGDEDEVT